jgi:hypothetical protein
MLFTDNLDISVGIAGASCFAGSVCKLVHRWPCTEVAAKTTFPTAAPSL